MAFFSSSLATKDTPLLYGANLWVAETSLGVVSPPTRHRNHLYRVGSLNRPERRRRLCAKPYNCVSYEQHHHMTCLPGSLFLSRDTAQMQWLKGEQMYT